ncbi:hypothetical protein [Emticicia sp. C21]|uniref:hypothetical protein n=1 Tax=Emticicia sp. C21 TaxID=2302915 RepID=UPI001314B562|nr:hypothetical protein [Emticicia sp. C21]
MTYKKLRLIAFALLIITILSIRCHVTITKNYYYSTPQQQLMRTETIIQVQDKQTGNEL